MARSSLEIATPHSDQRSENGYPHRTEGHTPCTNEITARSSRDYGSLATRLRLVALIPSLRTKSPHPTDQEFVPYGLFRTLLLLVVLLGTGIGNVWGQTHPYAGVWYLTVKKNTSYYMVPAKDPQITTAKHVYEDAYFSSDFSTQAGDPETPFITTYTTSGDLNSIWLFVPVSDENNYYYIVHALTGKYVKYQQYLTGGNARRKFVHLETIDNPGETEKFEITKFNVGVKIKPKNDAMYFNVAGDNQARYNGGTSSPYYSGMVGGMSGTDDNSQFNLIDASSAITLTPKISDVDEATNTFTITSPAAAFSTIRYTTNGSTTPDASTGTETTSGTPIIITDSWTVQAVGVFGSFVTPKAGPKNLAPILCAAPVISYDYSTKMISITCATEGATIHYTTDGSPATSSSTTYTGPFAIGSATTIRAIAVKAGDISNETIFLPPTEVSFSSEITDMNGNYILASNFSSTGSVGTSDNPFKGTIDGNFNPLTLSYPLVAYANGATIKNVILASVSISSGTNVGAICCEATGDTRIYNCGVLDGSVGGSNNVGGIVGLLDGRSRVINCYNYADITSGSACGGIVGYNNVASTSSNLQTMVMNCMFYSNITGDNAAPIYGGEIIHNRYASANDTGLNNYCYFFYDEEKNPYVKSIANDKYHGALGAEERYLNRFEFFRMTLNSTRNLAAFYVTGDATQKEEIAKWVLDKSIAPYPILKVQGTYPSIVNPDAAHATTQIERNKGGLLGTLSVTISGTGSGDVFSAPTGASITTTGSLNLNITDKDYDNFNFNYKKVQLPYYNEVGTGNYSGDRVVTGWKIVKINGSTEGTGSFTTDTYDYPSFNFVDRTCTNKDLYSVSGRVFAQGAYWEVPDGVTSITIEPYWAKAVYLSDANYDMTYTITISGSGSSATATANKYGVSVCGSCPTDYNGQTVYTDLSTALTDLGSNASHKVYDYAVVLVGNYHQAADNALVNIGKPVTFMSADLDGDNEPDNTLFYYHNQRKVVSPIRFDFLNIPGIGMVKRTHDATMDPEPGILAPQGWFEITNTAFIRFGQFEYAGSNAATKTILAPLILQGGIYEQFVSCTRTNAQNTNYLLIGGNAWFLNFANGCHTNTANKTPKVPINVAGGDYTNFYLTGIYQPGSNEDVGNAECYIDGGRFTEVAGAGMQQVKGDVTWLINAADITSFYGGGINAAKPITGSISTTISNSYVDEFYGGPKFGDMDEETTVTTNAKDCHFGKFFGAGYGGTAFNKVLPDKKYDSSDISDTRTWDSWVTAEYKRAYSSGNGGISTNYEYEFILHSDGNQTVARFYVDYASLSLASTRNVTNELTECTIGTFYGGGSLGAVNGDVNSTLTDCTVTGNAFGAGFSASVPTVEVWNAGANLVPNPTYNRTANVFNNASVKTPKDNGQYVVYTWSKTYGTNAKPFTDTEDGKHYIHTDVSLDGLGSVSGNAILNIAGSTTVGGNVYGGGEESGVGGSTQVFINNTGTAGTGNVFGAGKGLETDYTAALVKGNSTVTMSNGNVKGNIYGGGELASVGTFTFDTTDPYKIATWTDETGTTTVSISGGTVGNVNDYTYDADNRLAHTNGGNVFAGSKGVLKKSDNNYLSDWIKFARVRNTVLTVSGENTRIMSNIYGGGEIGSVGYLDASGAPVEGCGTSVTVSNGIIGTEIKKSDKTQYTFGSVFGGGYGSDLETTIEGETDPNAPKLFAGRIYGNTSVTMSDGAVKASVYGGGEMASVGGNATVTVSGGTIGIPKDGDKQFGGATMGNVYGGGSGNKNIVRAGQIFGNTTVSISQAENKTTRIYHNIYGGGAYGSVGTFEYTTTTTDPEYPGIEKVTGISSCTSGGTATITITGGTIGADGKENGMIFGSSRGDVGAPGSRDDLMAWVNNANVTIGTVNSATGPTIMGSVYGSGENGHTLNNTDVTIHSGKIGIDSGDDVIVGTTTYEAYNYPYRGNVYGGGCGTDKYYTSEIPEGHTATDGEGDSYNPKAGIVQGTATVTIDGGYIVHNVYGAGAMGSVGGGAEATSGKTTINISGGRIGYDGDGNGHIFGAARGEYGVSTAASGLANVRETAVNINYTTTPTADNEGKTAQLIAGSVFGGGEAGTVKESVAVNMTGGLILKDLYGGGALADTQTSNWDASANSGAGDWADTDKTSALHTTTVRLTGGHVVEEVFGGGLGEAGKPAYVWGDVLLDLNGTTTMGTDKPTTEGTSIANNAQGCAVGQVFGCNNVYGTPKGDVMVHVYATQKAGKSQIANTLANGNTPAVTDAKAKGDYDVAAVYGGGNQAAYDPVSPYTNSNTSGAKTQVIIEGCDKTSIETVYGGGNAAAVPETNVDIKSAFEIGYLFGGGNGKDDIAPGVENPGADVGTKDHGDTTYGTGDANTTMEGGLIHEAYGGSNQKGIIKGSINQTTNPDGSTCELVVEKIVGAGKYADVDGDVNMTLSCQPNKKVNELFAGADEANVNGNITLNITNGHFGNVFGGNNLGGAVKGKITVNVEETECQPIKIDNLYLGGNEAAYSVYGYYESEEIHPVTGKKILKPRTAEMHAITDPTAEGYKAPVTNPATDDTHSFPYAQPELNIISCTYIGNVFGGGFGKGAIMYADPTVSVNMVPGAHAATAVPAMMTELGLDVSKTAANPDKLGIIRNVYGGGDAADICGNTTVNIATLEGKSAYIIGSIFGGGNAADVLGNTNVTVSGGYVFNGIFGGGYAGSVGTFTRSTAAADVNIYGHTAHDGCIGKPVSCAEGTGKCTVVVNGGQIGPLSVATQGMNRSKAEGGPVPEGWVWGAGQGLVEDPATHPDTHFTSYVGSTDVTISGTALIMESIIGGGEFGRVLGNTLVKIEGGQIGIGANQTETVNNVLQPKRYRDDQFVNPLTTTVTDANALAECSHYPYGRNIGTSENPNWVYLPYDPYYDDNKTYADAHNLGPASTSDPSDGKTWIGCVFGGGSGYMPFKNASGYEWVRSAGWVEGNSEVRISGGHILTNVYGGNEVTDVKDKSIVKMTGGTIGVPRTLEQIAAHPLSCYLFGAGKGDDRSHFYDYTNVGSVEVEVSGGIIYGSVFGGSEDGHVTGDIKVDIKPGAIIGTHGTSYVDGNVFGAGRGFSGNTLTAGNVGGNVTLNISGGNILGSVYGGGRLASVGTYLVPSNNANYGELMPDNGNDKHGHITINISGGTIGNNAEYLYNPTIAQKAAIPNTTFDYQNHLQYTKGGNVFTAGMGRLYALDNKTVLPQWQKLGQCKQTVLNMTGGTVKSSVYGGGEIGIVAQNATVNIYGGTVGTKVVDSEDATNYYYFGSVFGGGKGSTENIEGISAAGTTQGNVEVHLNKTPSTKGAIVHQVFGCNDMNGSPKGTVTVHVYATQSPDKDNISTKHQIC